MLKVKFDTLWKLAVVLLLAIIAFYSYRIDTNFGGTVYPPGNVGCGGYRTPAAANPLLCVRPVTSQVK